MRSSPAPSRIQRGKLARIGVLAAGLLLPALAHAADVIGTVLQGHQRVAGVTVSLGQFAAVSDASGRFVIRSIRPGTYNLKCGQANPVTVRIMDGLNEVSCRVP